MLHNRRTHQDGVGNSQQHKYHVDWSSAFTEVTTQSSDSAEEEDGFPTATSYFALQEDSEADDGIPTQCNRFDDGPSTLLENDLAINSDMDNPPPKCCCSSRHDDAVRIVSSFEFWACHGPFFLGAVVSVLGEALDLHSALKQYKKDGWMDVVDDDSDDDNDDDYENGWYDRPVFLSWDTIKVCSVLSTSLYLLSVFTDISMVYPAISGFEWACHVFFGMAAVLDLLSSLCSDLDSVVLAHDSWLFGNASADMFLISALLEMASHARLYWDGLACCGCRSRDDRTTTKILLLARLVLAGDLCFLSGATMDAVTARVDLGDDDSNLRWLWIAVFSVLAAVCWTLNAICGMTVDLLELGDDDDSSSDGESEESVLETSSLTHPLLLNNNEP